MDSQFLQITQHIHQDSLLFYETAEREYVLRTGDGVGLFITQNEYGTSWESFKRILCGECGAEWVLDIETECKIERK